jgi:hypothetical protein
VLLSKKANAIEHLARAPTCFVEASAKAGIFALELFDPFGAGSSRRGRRFESFHSRFGFECAGTERRELVAEVPHQSVEIGERRLELSLFVV